MKERNDWENSEMIGQNKEPPHNTLIPFQDIDSALSGEFESSQFYKSLNGNWKFIWVKKPSERPIYFYKTDYNDDNWDVILVEKDGEIVASLPYYFHKKFTCKIINMPPLTQTMGPYIKYPENQKYGNRI